MFEPDFTGCARRQRRTRCAPTPQMQANVRTRLHRVCEATTAHPLRPHAPNAEPARHSNGFPCKNGLTAWHA